MKRDALSQVVGLVYIVDLKYPALNFVLFSAQPWQPGTVARAIEFLTLRVNFSQKAEWNTFAKFRPTYLGASYIHPM